MKASKRAPRIHFFLLVFAVSISGCGKQISNYVTGKQRPLPPAASPVPTNPSNPLQPGMKISPGANIALGSSVASRFAVTATQRTVQGNQVKSQFSFSRSRPSAIR